MPATIPHTFADGPGNTASGVEVMDNFNAVNAGVFMATVTSLPSSPVNGQDCYYLADATNGVVWHLKYRSASASAYKWEFVGGGGLQAEVSTLEARAATGAFGDLTTVGPSVTVPLAGDYEITVEVGRLETASVAGTYGEVAPQIGAAVPTLTGADSSYGSTGGAQIVEQSVSRTLRRNVSAASVVVKMVYNVTNTSTKFGNRHLQIKPVRVG